MIRMDIKGTEHARKKIQEYFNKAGITKKDSKGADFKAKTAIGLKLVNNIVNGSPREPVKAPIFDGYLRGSGGVHVGQKYVGGTEGYDELHRNYTHKENFLTVTVGFNAPYTAIQHEKLKPAGDYNPGERSKEDGNVGGKFVEKHVNADMDDLMSLYAEIFKKETGG